MLAIGSSRDDDRVIHRRQLIDTDVSAQGNIAEVAGALVLRDAVKHRGDRLELGVVRRDAEADQAVRHRQSPEYVDFDREPRVQERLYGIEPGRAAANHDDPQRVFRCPYPGSHGSDISESQFAPASLRAIQRRKLASGDRIPLRLARVDLDPKLLFWWQVDHLDDRPHGAGRNAGTTVDAHLGVDIHVIFAKVKTRDGAR